MIGLPPADILDEVAASWQAAGLNVDECFRAACSVTNEWVYTNAAPNEDPTVNVRARLRTRAEKGWASLIELRSVQGVLRPQQEAADVFLALLAWIDAADQASKAGRPAPPFARLSGAPIFVEERWWLTDAQLRGTAPTGPQPIDGDGPDLEDAADAAHEKEDEKAWSEDSGSASDGSSAEEPRHASDSLHLTGSLGTEPMPPQAGRHGLQVFDASPMWCRSGSVL